MDHWQLQSEGQTLTVTLCKLTVTEVFIALFHVFLLLPLTGGTTWKKICRHRLVQDGKPYRNEAMAQLQEDLVAAAAWERCIWPPTEISHGRRKISPKVRDICRFPLEGRYGTCAYIYIYVNICIIYISMYDVNVDLGCSPVPF